MKKTIILIAIAVTLGFQNPVISSNISISMQQLEETKKLLSETKALYDSITGPRQLEYKKIMNLTKYYFKNPEFIYGKNGFQESEGNEKNITFQRPEIKDTIISQDLSRLSVSEARQLIEKRRQYAEIVDKAISLHAFEKAEARSEMVEVFSAMVSNNIDLKIMLELQSYFQALFSIFKNEAT
ncbi:type IV secretion system protein, partial [Bartonella florencae]|uniref:type IV secretion system protein n=1 Tax=Bartonella florencae TaxID=928210 RepID=UPI000563176F